MSVQVNGTNSVQRDRAAKMLIWACFFLLLMVHGSKNAYIAEVVALQDVFAKSKAEISLAMTYYFITYAITQIVLSFLMGKINLKIFMSVTVGLSAILTMLIAFMPSISGIYVLCSINGVLQAGTYSGGMAVISKYAPPRFFAFANTLMSSASALYGFISYGVTALFVGMGRWDLPFIILGALLFVSACFFFYAVNKMRSFPKVELVKEEVAIVNRPYVKLNTKSSKIVFIIIMMLIAFLGNFLHYSVMNWVPDMLHSIFSMPKEYSILITLLVPLAMFVGSVVAIRICERFRNLFVIGIISLVAIVILYALIALFYDVNIVLTLVIMVITFMTASAQRLVYTSIMAFKMATEVNVGTFTAATNAFASISAGVAPTVAGSIIDAGQGNQGYGTLFIFVLLLCVVMLAFVTLISIYYLNKKRKEKAL
ncbi:MAG: MFS transporter [Clostridia bacterium]|nr:MFS transporter [Clostridia bacterium]